MEEEFAQFVADAKPASAEAIPAIKTFFKAYVTSDQIRHIIESKSSPIGHQSGLFFPRLQGRPLEISLSHP